MSEIRDYAQLAEEYENLHKDDKQETKECKICGEFKDIYNNDNLDNFGICEECEENISKFKIAIEVGKEVTTKCELNGVLACIFSNDEIEKILINHMYESCYEIELEDVANSFYQDNKEEYIDEYKKLED